MTKRKTDNENLDFPDFIDIDYNPDKQSLAKSDILSRAEIDADSLGLKTQETILRYRQDTKERKLLSHWVVWVVSIWLLLTITVLLLNRLLRFNLSDVVCCTLLGTTTANILGLAFIVLQGLFPNNKERKKK